MNHDTPTLPLDGLAQLFEEENEARRQTETAELTRILREPLGNVNKATQEIEHNSPLFYGTGHNPTLF